MAEVFTFENKDNNNEEDEENNVQYGVVFELKPEEIEALKIQASKEKPKKSRLIRQRLGFN